MCAGWILSGFFSILYNPAVRQAVFVSSGHAIWISLLATSYLWRCPRKCHGFGSRIGIGWNSSSSVICVNEKWRIFVLERECVLLDPVGVATKTLHEAPHMRLGGFKHL